MMSLNQERAGAVPWIICFAVLLVYLCFPTKVYYWDGIAFAQTIEDARELNTSLIHPNHLFYEVFGYFLYKIVRAVGIDARALTILQIANSILSAVAALLLFHLLRRSLRSLYLSCALTFLFAFSATWWKFSTDADAYIPSVLLMLASLYFILSPPKPRPLVLALVYSLSMCLHQLAGIFFPVLALGLFWQATELTRRQRLINVLKFSLVAFLITFGAYYYCFYLVTATLDFKSLLRWMTSFSPDVSFSFDVGSNLSYTMRGYWRLFFGGRFNALNGLYNLFIVVLLGALAALFLLFIFALIRGRRNASLRGQPSFAILPRLRPVLWLCGLWIGSYTIFLFVWLPQNTFYRLFYLPAVILLAGILLASSKSFNAHRQTYRVALFGAVMSLANFLFLIFPSAHAQKYPPLVLALEMNEVWPRGTVIYYSAINSDISLFRYFNPPTVWQQLHASQPRELESELQNIYNNGGTAWLEVTAIEQLSGTPEGAQWLARHAKADTRRELVNSAHKIKFVQIIP